MAQKITVELEDDLDGGPADQTVRFGVDGAEYEIDLSKKNAAALRRTLAPFIDHARKAGRGSAAGRGGPRAGSAAAISGRGRKTRASRSAPAGVSRQAWWSNTKPPPEEGEARRVTAGAPDRIPLRPAGYGIRTGGRRTMQLGKELAAGFVSDDEQVTAAGEAAAPADGADAKAPEVPPVPIPQPEPTAAG